MTSLNEQNTINEEEMSRLIDAYGNELLRLCTLYLKDKYLAEDALQETYIKVWQNYSSYKGMSNEKTWLTRIAINTCKNYLRTRWYSETDTSDLMEIVRFPRNDYKQVEESIDLMNGILGLKDKYRVVMLMYYYQELSVKEIAEVLGKKESTILSLLGRGRKILKTKLGEDYAGKEFVYEY